MDSKKELKVLVVAENASAKKGGEAILPLHYFTRLKSRGIETYLLVHERVREELDSDYPSYSKEILYVKDLKLQKFLYMLSKPFPRRISENTFLVLIQFLSSLRQRAIIKSMVREGAVNVVHQPIPVSPKQPSFIYNVGAPVIIGPMNGGMTYPDGFLFMENKLVKYFVAVGRSSSALANIILPGKKKAALLLASNRRTLDALPSSAAKNQKLMVENGVDLSLWEGVKSQDDIHEIPEFIYMGRLVDWKGVNYLLDAFYLLFKEQKAKLTIVGDGNELQNLKNQSAMLGLNKQVEFAGFISQAECANLLLKSTALVLPSLYECGGAVVLEAMAASKPVIAVDWGGPSDYLNSESGILIKPKSPDYLVRKLAESMMSLSKDAALASKMGRVGRKRVEDLFDWDKKINEMILHYKSVLQ